MSPFQEQIQENEEKVAKRPLPNKNEVKTAKRPLPNKSNESISSQTSPSQQIQRKVT